MKNAVITIYQVVQDFQEYGCEDENMVSRVFFNLEIDGKTYEGLYANIKQPIGSSFESSILEISGPIGYKGPFNYDAFRSEVEKVFRSLVGTKGSGISISSNASNIHMYNNKFIINKKVNFEVDDTSGAW